MTAPRRSRILGRSRAPRRAGNVAQPTGDPSMKASRLAVALASLLLCSAPALAASSARTSDYAQASNQDTQAGSLVERLSKPMSSTTTGTVTVEGKPISYQAEAGTLVLDGTGADEGKPQVAMSYVAYFKQGTDASKRPITFIYNGGPGSATVWLHMGAWGPKRVVTADDTHSPAAPYQVIDNDQTLLDASDLVFIDAPSTGFSRIAGKDKEKAFYGIDPDGEAFTTFIQEFLAKYNRFNSPKYLFGESYGTPRSAVVVNDLETQHSIDFNGVIL